MKKLLFSTIADPHLSDKNIPEVETALKLAIDKTLEKGSKLLFIIGDIFTDRKSQSFQVLQAFGRVLDYAFEKGVYIEGFPGNHDKIDYQSERSYLDVYRHYPAFNLATGIGEIVLDGGKHIFTLPFYREVDALLPYLEELKGRVVPEGSVLLTHLAIDGVKNNDGTEVKGILKRDAFKRFLKVLVGHYHDKQEFDNITYIGSLLQNNFGEDDLKGITYYYDNDEIEQESLSPNGYLTVSVDLHKVSNTEIETLVSIYEDSDNKIRFKFEGTRAQFKNVTRPWIEAKGIKVAFKEDLVEEVDINKKVADNFSAFTGAAILTEWDDYCSKDRNRKEVHKKGKEILNEIL